MTRIEQLAAAAQDLTDDQLDGLIAYARYLDAESVYETAPPEVRASIARGLEQLARGEAAPVADALRRIRERHGLSRA